MKDHTLEQTLDQSPKLPTESARQPGSPPAATPRLSPTQPGGHPSSKRRLVVSTFLGGSAAVLSDSLGHWSKPVVESVLLPAHAQATPPVVVRTKHVLEIPEFEGGTDEKAGAAAVATWDFAGTIIALQTYENAYVRANGVQISNSIRIQQSTLPADMAEDFADAITGAFTEPNYVASATGTVLTISQAVDPDTGEGGDAELNGQLPEFVGIGGLAALLTGTSTGTITNDDDEEEDGPEGAFYGGVTYVPLTQATTEFTVVGYDARSGNGDGYIIIDGLGIDFARANLSALEVADRIIEVINADLGRIYTAERDADLAEDVAEVTITLTQKAAGEAGNVELSVGNNDYSI